MGKNGEPTNEAVVALLVGSWTYRSFRNVPEITTPIDQVLFGRGELVIESVAPGSFSGRLNFSPTYQFKLTGETTFGDPVKLRFQGVGDAPDAQGHVYDYLGYLAPTWPDGVDQRPAIVGSIVRTVAHGPGAPAGEVASWIAVKRD